MRARASRSIRRRCFTGAASIGTSCNTGRAGRCFTRKCAAGGCAANSRRHCERKRSNPARRLSLDCFVASLLAMTKMPMRLLLPLPHIDEMPGDGGGGGHGRRNEMRAALVALAALEIAVRGRGAAFAGIELVGIH